MRRSSAPLVAVIGVFAGGGLLFGFRGGGPMSTLLPASAVLGVVIVAFRGKRDRILPELEWGRAPSAPAVPAAPSAARPAPAGSPATGLPPGVAVTAAPRVPSSPRQLATALARAEAYKLVFDPWFGVGIGFCVLMVALFGWVWAPDDANRPWSFVFANLPVMAHPMAGMAVVAAHRAVTRARRDGAAELFDTCPLPPVTRTAGHLLTGWVPAAALAVFSVVYLLVTAVRTGLVYGPLGGPAAADVAAVLSLGAGAVALGVAPGRWAPWRLAPMVAAAGAGIAQTRPISGSGAMRLASLVAEPERHQSCLSVRRVSVCAYRGYSAYAGAMIAEVAPVMAATPRLCGPWSSARSSTASWPTSGPRSSAPWAAGESAAGTPSRSDSRSPRTRGRPPA